MHGMFRFPRSIRVIDDPALRESRCVHSALHALNQTDVLDLQHLVLQTEYQQSPTSIMPPADWYEALNVPSKEVPRMDALPPAVSESASSDGVRLRPPARDGEGEKRPIRMSVPVPLL